MQPWLGPGKALAQDHEGASFIDNLLVRMHFIIARIQRTGIEPWVFAYLFPGSLVPAFLLPRQSVGGGRSLQNRVETRSPLLTATAPREKMTFGNPFQHSGVVAERLHAEGRTPFVRHARPFVGLFQKLISIRFVNF